MYSIFLNQGHFVYILDDPYIHMNMAKNFSEFGHWATNKLNFTSASSSPLWTLILSGVYFLFGDNEFIPFILNILFGIIAIFIVYSIFKKNNISKYLSILLIFFIYITPLPAMLFTGMEHSLQISIALLFLYLGCNFIVNGSDKQIGKYLILITPLITSIRYEGFFIVFVVAILLILRKNLIYASIMLIVGLAPILLYGFISISHGWYFLPNTILLKSGIELTLHALPKLIFRAYKNITLPHIFLMLMASSILYIYRYTKLNELWTKKQVYLIIFFFTTVINMSLIDYNENGWFYRYEAYLIAIGFVAIIINVYDIIQNHFIWKVGNRWIKYIVLPFIFLIILSPLLARSFTFFLIPTASNNIYEQHFQVAQLIKECGDVNIAANDIGMINYYSNNYILDLWGLANSEIANQRLKKMYNTEKINEITMQHNIKFVIVYEHWFDQYGGLPKNWIKLGDWAMTKYNLICGSEMVSFYCLNQYDANIFKEKLERYSKRLPTSIVYKIY